MSSTFLLIWVFSGEIIMTIGNRVLELLLEKNLTQKELAQYLGTKPSTINGWKEPNRNPSSRAIVPIREFLGVSYEYLLTGKAAPATFIAADNSEWLSLIYQLPPEKQYELKGYIKRMIDESVAADAPLKKTGTTNSVK